MASEKPNIGDLVRLYLTDGTVLEGIVMPLTEFSGSDIIVVKLKNGYNIGVSRERVAKVEVIQREAAEIGKVPPPARTEIEGRGEKNITLISTGGTIASKVEYETGAVRPAITASELVEMVPDLRGIAKRLRVVELMRVLSEDMRPTDWAKIAEEILAEIRSGADAVVVAHGTDTMGYTAAAIAFALQKLPIPVAFVGSQRSSDRPSTDAVFNLRAATATSLKAPFGESVVVMHGTPSDTYALAHRGVRVRKMHSSRRDAFQSINTRPLAKLSAPDFEVELLTDDYIPRNNDGPSPSIGFDERVALLYTYPGMRCEIIEYIAQEGAKGIVLAGTGLGHIPSYCIPSVKRAVDSGIFIGVTTQTLFGRVNLNVYSNGRRLIKAGAVPLADMLPETAYVKLSWALANFSRERVTEVMLTNIVGEISLRHEEDVYPRWYHG